MQDYMTEKEAELQMDNFQTEKGTRLPLLNLKGKVYLPVAQRVQWFREKHPLGRIDTECLSTTDKFVIFKATISVPNEKNEYVKLADADKQEHFAHFGDAMEKAQTGAIGRALALCGFGTQFATELEEGSDRIVDSPIAPKPKAPITTYEPAENNPFITKSQQALIQLILEHGYQDAQEISGILKKLVGKPKTRDLDDKEILVVRQWFMNNPKPIFK